MEIKKIDLYNYFGVKRQGDFNGELIIYSHGVFPSVNENRKRPAILILGGGGYEFVSDREKEPIALEYFSKGFDTFILEYTVAPQGHFPTPLIEACMAVKYMRENAQDLHIIADKIVSIGFSAGGHLLGLLSNLCDIEEVFSVLGKGDYRPNLSIYSYAVLLSAGKTHSGSIINITNANEKLVDKMDIVKSISKKSPPAFIWCTANDDCVPAENSLALAVKYKELNIPFELHVFENGVHGLSVCNMETANKQGMVLVNEAASQWIPLSITWLKNRGFCVEE